MEKPIYLCLNSRSYFIEHNDFLVNEEIKQIDEYVKKNFKRLSSNFDNSFKFVR